MMKQQIEDQRNSAFATGKVRVRQSAIMIQVWVWHKSRWKCYGFANDEYEADRLHSKAINKGWQKVRAVDRNNKQIWSA